MIYLIRHGLDDERFIGGYSNIGLVDDGINQINSAGDWILDQSLNIKKIYTSDIVRAVESAKLISNKLNLDVCVNCQLREQDKGILNGMNREEANKNYLEYLLNQDVCKRYPCGESLMDLYLRIKDFLKDISYYDDCLLVTHRGVINMIYYLLYNDELDMNKSRYNVTHGSIHELNIFKSKIRRIR